MTTTTTVAAAAVLVQPAYFPELLKPSPRRRTFGDAEVELFFYTPDALPVAQRTLSTPIQRLLYCDDINDDEITGGICRAWYSASASSLKCGPRQAQHALASWQLTSAGQRSGR